MGKADEMIGAAEAIHSTSSPYIYCYGGDYAPIYSEGAAQ